MKLKVFVRIRVLTILFLSASCIDSQNQSNGNPDNYYSPNISEYDSTIHLWYSGGAGVDNNGIGFNIGLNYRMNSGSLISLRYIRSSEYSWSLIIFDKKEPNESFNELSLLYGYCYKTRSIYTSVSAGGGFVFGKLRCNLRYVNYNGWFSKTEYYEEDNFITFGLPLQAQFFWTPSESFGVGLIGYANINKSKSICGLMLNIAVGVF